MATMTASELLQEAQVLRKEIESAETDVGGLVPKIMELGDKLRSASGLVSLERDYHKAARNYSEVLEIVYRIANSAGLDLPHLRTVGYNIHLAQ